MPDSSQGSDVIWNYQTIGYLTGFQCSPGSAVFAEKTNVTSAVVGTGANSRVVKQYDCVAIEPGSVSVTMYGVPPYVVDDIGVKGPLQLATPGGSLSCDAYLESFEVTGSVGEWLAGQARFRIA
jgi:hypothetical protein